MPEQQAAVVFGLPFLNSKIRGMKNYKNKVYLFLYVSLVIVLGSFAILFTNFRKQVKLQNKILKIT